MHVNVSSILDILYDLIPSNKINTGKHDPHIHTSLISHLERAQTV